MNTQNAAGWTGMTGMVSAALVAAVVAAAGGCQDRRDHRVNGAVFRPEGETRAVHRFTEAQAAAGARTDATLRAYDFDCSDLNSLGRRKLDLMVKDDDTCTPLVIYLDVPQDGAYDPRQDSVEAYLKGRALTDAQIKVVAGPNVNNLGPTSPAIRAKKLLDVGAPVALNPEPLGSSGGK